MKTTSSLKRLQEIKFFFFCRHIIYKTKNLAELHALIRTLSFTKLYDPDILIAVITEMFVQGKNNPDIIECAILADFYPNKLKQKEVAKEFKISTTDVQNKINEVRMRNLGLQSVHAAYLTEVFDAIYGFKKALKQLASWDDLEYETRTEEILEGTLY